RMGERRGPGRLPPRRAPGLRTLEPLVVRVLRRRAEELPAQPADLVAQSDMRERLGGAGELPLVGDEVAGSRLDAPLIESGVERLQALLHLAVRTARVADGAADFGEDFVEVDALPQRLLLGHDRSPFIGRGGFAGGGVTVRRA